MGLIEEYRLIKQQDLFQQLAEPVNPLVVLRNSDRDGTVDNDGCTSGAAVDNAKATSTPLLEVMRLQTPDPCTQLRTAKRSPFVDVYLSFFYFETKPVKNKNHQNLNHQIVDNLFDKFITMDKLKPP